MKITIVEDNELLAKQVAMVLKREGYEVEYFHDANSFLENFDRKSNLLLLDINLPDMQGTELFELLQKCDVDMKTIFVTSYTDMDHVGKAFRLGCEDYLKKPFELEELLLRIKRIENSIGLSNKKLGKYQFDLENFTVVVDDKRVKVTKQEAELLKLFLSNLDKVVTFEYLNEKIWNSEVNTNTITVAVLRLRKKLGLDNLENIREVGYIFHRI
jgi:DNA-binding response OmpR family regulator